MAREACERYEAAAADARAALAADPSERRASDITRRCASAAAAERTREARLAAYTRLASKSQNYSVSVSLYGVGEQKAGGQTTVCGFLVADRVRLA